jgi:hypothetical protein
MARSCRRRKTVSTISPVYEYPNLLSSNVTEPVASLLSLRQCLPRFVPRGGERMDWRRRVAAFLPRIPRHSYDRLLLTSEWVSQSFKRPRKGADDAIVAKVVRMYALISFIAFHPSHFALRSVVLWPLFFPRPKHRATATPLRLVKLM